MSPLLILVIATVAFGFMLFVLAEFIPVPNYLLKPIRIGIIILVFWLVLRAILPTTADLINVIEPSNTKANSLVLERTLTWTH